MTTYQGQRFKMTMTDDGWQHLRDSVEPLPDPWLARALLIALPIWLAICVLLAAVVLPLLW